jgi:hypothetical protein
MYALHMTTLDRIKEIEMQLLSRKISVSQLCRRADLAQTTWVRWKKAEYPPSVKAWARVEAAFAAICLDPQRDAA